MNNFSFFARIDGCRQTMIDNLKIEAMQCIREVTTNGDTVSADQIAEVIYEQAQDDFYRLLVKRDVTDAELGAFLSRLTEDDLSEALSRADMEEIDFSSSDDLRDLVSVHMGLEFWDVCYAIAADLLMIRNKRY